jgi:hypothetical protein
MDMLNTLKCYSVVYMRGRDGKSIVSLEVGVLYCSSLNLPFRTYSDKQHFFLRISTTIATFYLYTRFILNYRTF